MRRILEQDFFERNMLVVAEELLGKFIVRNNRGREVVAMITEVEAYGGFEDKASHARHGETLRNAPMFGDAGVWYVYLVYGMHWMLNVVTGKRGYPAGVLIRGVEGVSGPGRVTKYFKVSSAMNAKRSSRSTDLWIEDRGVRITKRDILRTSRIGVAYAGEWAAKPYRFILKTKTPHKRGVESQ